jgi:hypothetical protein
MGLAAHDYDSPRIERLECWSIHCPHVQEKELPECGKVTKKIAGRQRLSSYSRRSGLVDQWIIG